MVVNCEITAARPNTATTAAISLLTRHRHSIWHSGQLYYSEHFLICPTHHSSVIDEWNSFFWRGANYKSCFQCFKRQLVVLNIAWMLLMVMNFFDFAELAISPNNNEVHVYNKQNGKWTLNSTLSQHDLRVTSIDWAKSSNRIVTCSAVRWPNTHSIVHDFHKLCINS